jgi:hypothetical protein
MDALLDYLYDEGDPGRTAGDRETPSGVRDLLGCGTRDADGARDAGRMEAAAGAARLADRAGAIGRARHDAVPPRQWWNVPASYRSWAQVAAGAMLFVAGMAVSQLNVHYADGALTVRAGSEAPALAPMGRTASIHLPAAPVRGGRNECGLGQARSGKRWRICCSVCAR